MLNFKNLTLNFLSIFVLLSFKLVRVNLSKSDFKEDRSSIFAEKNNLSYKFSVWNDFQSRELKSKNVTRQDYSAY